VGSGLGLSSEKILALGDYASSPQYDDRERAALEYADAMSTTGGNVDDLVELTTLIAWENASSRFNRALRIPSQGLWR
jgi:alkylhydroperoxidase family enzyme